MDGMGVVIGNGKAHRTGQDTVGGFSLFDSLLCLFFSSFPLLPRHYGGGVSKHMVVAAGVFTAGGRAGEEFLEQLEFSF